jgi:MFS family permease
LGAILVSILAGTIFRHSSGHLWVLSVSLILAGVACIVLPHYAVLAFGVAGYVVMGSGRGMAGVGINSALMHEVPRQLMGRTQNVINFTAIAMQLVLTMAVGWLGQHISLGTGFYAVASFYLAGGLLGLVIARMPKSGAKLEALPFREIVMPQVEAAEL